MNPELEARLRRFGASIDAATAAAEARRAGDRLRSPLGAADVSRLEPADVPARRQPRFYRVLAVAAAAAAVAIAVGVVVARSGSPHDSGDLAVGDSSPAVESTAAPTTEARPPATAAAPTTSSASTTTNTTTNPEVVRPSVACPTYRTNDTLPLRMCDKGEAVRAVQQRLSEMQLGLLVDGYFGPSTRAAVREFQRQRGLEVDGLVGPNTWNALFGTVAATSADSTSPV